MLKTLFRRGGGKDGAPGATSSGYETLRERGGVRDAQEHPLPVLFGGGLRRALMGLHGPIPELEAVLRVPAAGPWPLEAGQISFFSNRFINYCRTCL